MKVIRILSSLIMVSAILVSCDKGGGGQDPEPGKSLNLKVMSFNLRSATMSDEGNRAWSARKTAVQSMVNEKQPAVIGMQEATTEQRTDLKKLLPDYTLLEVPNTGGTKGGNTIMMYRTADYNLLQCYSYYLSSTPDKPSVNGWNDETQYRTTIWVELQHKTTGHKFFVFNTHMPLNKNTAEKGITARTNSAELNVNRMKKEAGEKATVFIVGDMNCTTPETGTQKYYDWPMSDARKTAVSTDSKNSFNNWGGSGSKIDYIFYRNVSAAAVFETVDKNYGVPYISDHYPIMLTVTLL